MTAKAILFINIQMNKNLFHICLIGIIFIMMVGCKRASTSEKFAQKAVLENKTYPQKINDSIIIVIFNFFKPFLIFWKSFKESFDF